MNYLTFDPYRELNTLQQRLFGSGRLARREPDEEMSLGAWIPPVDIEEDKERIVLTAELPGFREDQIDIQMEGGVLTLRGERKFEDKENGKGKNYHRVERSYGQFVRSFTLPNNVDRDNIKANFSDGLLRVELPKREEAKPKQIKISGSGGPSKKEAIDVKTR